MDAPDATSDDRNHLDRLDPFSKPSDELLQLHIQNTILLGNLDALQIAFQELQSKSAATEEVYTIILRQRDDAVEQNAHIVKSMEEVSIERDGLRDELRDFQGCSREREDELRRKIEDEVREKQDLVKEIEILRERIEELESHKNKTMKVFSQSLESIRSVKECLVGVIENLDEDKSASVVEECSDLDGEYDLDEESKAFLLEFLSVLKLPPIVEAKVREYQELRKKEKKQLENSVVSLTEENRDINSLLRIALVEKEAVEKSLSRLKGNNEQKRVAILQIAERGLQRVGFGFMMGAAPNETSENMSSNMSSKSDGSECEEEVVSLASAVERIMKNLRLEISQLRTSLDESRSDNERLQSLTEKQAQKIAENTLYIKELEDRETVLAQNVEELLKEIKEVEEDVVRWREACELEVEAGKNVIEERDKVTAILKEELEKTKAALEVSNSKLKLKEDLAAAAMAAQAAAERSLQLADSRAAGLRERIEELTKQLEEAERRERSGRRVRHICWPWRALKSNPTATNNTNNRIYNVKRMLPEMQALLHSTV